MNYNGIVWPLGRPSLFGRVGHEAFAAGYASAMQVTLLVSAAALVVAALSCFGLDRRSPLKIRRARGTMGA